MRRVLAVVLTATFLLVGAGAAAVVLLNRSSGSADTAPSTTTAAVGGHHRGKGLAPTVSTPAPVSSPTPDPLTPPALPPLTPASTSLSIAFKKPPLAGILFDVKTGQILWSLNPQLNRPIASLTKMMTALLIAERHKSSEQVQVSPKASKVPGSRIGLLRPGRKYPLGPVLAGLLMVSGNDAAVALAEHDAGSVPAFVAEMNAAAKQLDLSCSHFTTPNGLRDRGNYSCAYDLATLARLDLANPALRTIIRQRDAALPSPTRGGKLQLGSLNPFLRLRYPGITGVKTGYTIKAGRCYVITQRRDSHELGVVLLHSQDPLRDVPRVLDAGFRSLGIVPPPSLFPPKRVQPRTSRSRTGSTPSVRAK
jgi:serine-type D-Ala-D-Ala carboxypeptidase (penicillin-binding protein 5/6)